MTQHHTAELDPINFIKTGGQFGKKRRLPTFAIVPKENGFSAFDENDNMRFKASSPTLEGLEKLLRPYSNQRTRTF